MRIILGGLLLEIAVGLFLIHFCFISDTSSYALAITALAEAPNSEVKPERATGQFINELKNSGLMPVPVKQVKRAPFSVKGTIVVMNGDNLQIFEYPDHHTASNEAAIFIDKYTKSSTSNKWKNMKHLYVRDNIIIFYMGTKKDILDVLDKDMNPHLLSN